MYEIENKQALRSKCKALRAELKNPAHDLAIAQAALAAFADGYESFFLYLSVKTEVGTEHLKEELLRMGKRVCVPFVSGKEMRAVRYTDKLVSGAFGIPQPHTCVEEACQIAFTPMLAADEEGYRLGYGGGFYDRWFALHPEVLRVGLCYEGQLLPALPREETDIPLDAIVTEKGVRFLRARNA